VVRVLVKELNVRTTANVFYVRADVSHESTRRPGRPGRVSRHGGRILQPSVQIRRIDGVWRRMASLATNPGRRRTHHHLYQGTGTRLVVVGEGRDGGGTRRSPTRRTRDVDTEGGPGRVFGQPGTTTFGRGRRVRLERP
jgi:hypothetical protein